MSDSIDFVELPNSIQAGHLHRMSFHGSSSNSPAVALTRSSTLRTCFYLKPQTSKCSTPTNGPSRDRSIMSHHTSMFGNIPHSLSLPSIWRCRKLAPGSPLPSSIDELPISSSESHPIFLLADFEKLILDKGDVDALFGLAFLYDIHSQRRVSETFHFDSNSENLFQSFVGSESPQQLQNSQWETCARCCIFRISPRSSNELVASRGSMIDNSTADREESRSRKTITNFQYNPAASAANLAVPNDHVLSQLRTTTRSNQVRVPDSCCTGGLMLVIRVEKVLQGIENSELYDGLLKDEKNKEKIRNGIAVCSRRLGQYRMPVAWTAVDLTPMLLAVQKVKMKKTNLRLSGMEEVTLDIPTFQRSLSVGPENRYATYLDSSDKRSAMPNRMSEPVKSNGHVRSTCSDDEALLEYSSLDPFSEDIGRVVLNIKTFYRYEMDKFDDEEIGRCLNEIHRQTTSVCGQSSKLGSSQEFIHPTAETPTNSSSLTNLMDPNASPLKRLKSFSLLGLQLKLSCSSIFSLLNLLRSTGSHISDPETDSFDQAPLSPSVQSRTLLNPEGIPYRYPLFIDPPADRTQPIYKWNHPIREILELPTPLQTVPFNGYRNLIYIYPRNIGFTSTRLAYARNICIRIQLCCFEQNVNKIIPAIYGRSHSPLFLSDAYTTVLYHSREAELYDEIKLQLPEKLDESHHILFTFYHLSCQIKKVDSKTSLESILGYSWLPVLQNGRLVGSDRRLLISMIKPTASMVKSRPELKDLANKSRSDAFRWLDPGREMFRVETVVISSTCPQHPSIEYLLKAVQPRQVEQTLKELQTDSFVIHLTECMIDAPIQQLFSFFAILLDGLLRLLLYTCLKSVRHPTGLTNDNQTLFRVFYLVTRFVEYLNVSLPEGRDPLERSCLLVAYLAGPNCKSADLVFWSEFCGTPLFGLPLVVDLLKDLPEENQEITECLPEQLFHMFEVSSTVDRFNLIPRCSWWFIFELIVRLLVENRTRNPVSGLDRSSMYAENDPLLRSLDKFITGFRNKLVCNLPSNTEVDADRCWANRYLAFFIFDLIDIVPDAFIATKICEYCKAFDDRLRNPGVSLSGVEVDGIMSLKLDFLEITCSHWRYHELVTIVSQPEISPPTYTLIDDQEGGGAPVIDYCQTGSCLPALFKHFNIKFNFMTWSIALFSTIECCLNLKFTHLHQRAASCVQNTFLRNYNVDVYRSPKFRLSSVEIDGRIDVEPVLLLGFLDVLNRLLDRIALSCQQIDTKNVRMSISDISKLEGPTDPSMLESADGVIPKSTRRKTHRSMKHKFGSTREIRSTSRTVESKPRLFVLPNSMISYQTSSMFDVPVLRSLFFSMVQIIHNSAYTVLQIWLRSISQETLNRFIILQHFALSVYNSKPHSEMSSSLESSIDQVTTKHRTLPREHMVNLSTISEGSRIATPSWRDSGFASAPAELRGEVIELVIGNLEQFVQFSIDDLQSSTDHPVLNLINEAPSEYDKYVPYSKVQSDSDAKVSTPPLELCIRVLLAILKSNPVNHVVPQLFPIFSSIMHSFCQFLFDDNLGLFAAITHQLIYCCSSTNRPIKSKATTLLHDMLLGYFKYKQNISRPMADIIRSVTFIYIPMEKLTTFGHQFSAEDVYRRRQSLTSSSSVSLLTHHMYLKESLNLLEKLALPYKDESATTDATEQEAAASAAKNKGVIHQAMESNKDNFGDFLSLISRMVKRINGLLDDAARLHVLLAAPSHPTTHDLSKLQLSHNSERVYCVIDVLYSLANWSRILPELRLYWLMQITERHYELAQFSEAAQCLSHCTAIVAEHMANRGDLSVHSSVTGCASISEAVNNVNLLEESCPCDTTTAPQSNAPCCPPPVDLPDSRESFKQLDTSFYFTYSGWFTLITWAAASFSKAGLCEIVPRVYDKLIPVLKESNQFQKLTEVHGRIREAYNEIERQQNRKRLFNSYFRIGLYGSLFGSMNGMQYVYREAPFTKLPDMSQRIKSYYDEKFGANNVVLLVDSKPVMEDKLELNKAYLQITYVEPFFEDFELKSRPTVIERNYELKRFAFVVPFTPGGSAHGSLTEQHQRKTILTTEKNFPYIKSRLPVVSSVQHVLCPIEVATVDVSRRVDQLDEALNSQPRDLKIIQMVLQGCIGTTVNQGPVEVAVGFLSEGPPQPLPESTTIKTKADYVDAQNRLRVWFTSMLERSYQALHCRDESDLVQAEYYKEMERQYENVQQKTAHLLKMVQ